MREILPANEAQWHALRRKHVGSTESAALFGASPYMSAFEMAVAKKRGIEMFRENERTTWGKRLQGSIAGAFEEEFNVRVERADHRYYELEDIGFGASIDHIIRDANSSAEKKIREFYKEFGPGLLEIKNVDSWIFRDEWQHDRAPTHIEIQLQHQLAATELRWGAIFALVGGNHTHMLLRESNVEAQQEIKERVQRFWEQYNLGVLPDPMMPRDAKALLKLFGDVDPEKVLDAKNDPQLISLLDSYEDFRQKSKDAQELAEVAHARILQIIGDAAVVQNCGKYKIWAGPVKATHVEFDRAAYRGFRVTKKREKSDGKNSL